MRCTACQHDNDPGTKFCEECGNKLARVCLACGVELKPTSKFCPECGAAIAVGVTATKLPVRNVADYTPKHLADKILQSKSALEGERKQVTVLFADIQGSMELAGQLDPEEWHRILERFFAVLTNGVHRFEGTVNQYTGDGIMALFGAPLAHEDHGQRACLTALHLREALRDYADTLRRTHGLSFATRMGLNSGEVVVGSIGDDLRMDYTAQGHTVGLAQRMEQLAEPGAIFLTAHTAHLVEGYFALRELGTFELKGVAAPLEVFALEGLGAARTRLDLSQSRGFSKFVGRADEIATLEVALEQGVRGPGRTVGVVAEAGTGKSRLCFEFLERCRARGYTVVETRGIAHGRHVPLLPMLDLFRTYFGVQRTDDDQVVREKIAGRLLLLDASLGDDLPIFFNLLGVTDPERPLPQIDPELLQRRAYAAVRAIVRADSQRHKPAIVFVEDLHWLDATSDAYLAEIVEATVASRGLVLVNFRPEYRAPWMQMQHYQQLPLVPLGADAVRELLDDLLGGDYSVAGLAGFVHRRAGGNPFFVEEIVQTLIETGAMRGSRGCYRLVRPVEELALPATVQAVLAARIDRLEERDKRVLQQASVIGKTFQARVLARITDVLAVELDAALRALCTAEFLHETALYPQLEYTFKHPLTQEVAATSQLNERRAQTHAAVARVIEEMSADDLDEQAALLAHHWAAAGEYATAARWHACAARWIGVSNYAESSAHWRQVVNLIAEDTDSLEALALRAEALRNLLMLAYRIDTPEQEAATLFDAGRRALERLGDDAARAALLVAYATLRQNAGASDDYVALAGEAYQLAQGTGDRAVAAASAAEYCIGLYEKGRLSESLAIAVAARTMCAGDTSIGIGVLGYSPYVVSYIFELLPLLALGRIDDAELSGRRGIELSQQQDLDETRSWAHALFAFVGDARGAPTFEAVQSARLGVEAAERFGSDHTRAVANIGLALAHLLVEQWQPAMVAAETVMHVWRTKCFFGDYAPLMLFAHARALLGTGAVERALADCREGIDIARRQNQPLHLCEGNLIEARCLRPLHGAAARTAIDTSLVEAMQVIEQTGAELWRPHVHVERGELCRLQGDTEGAQREFVTAHRLFEATGASGYAARMARELAASTALP